MPRIKRRVLTGAVAVLLATLLAACLPMLGKFSSQLDVRKNGAFTYTYTGDIVPLPLASPNSQASFTPDL